MSESSKSGATAQPKKQERKGKRKQIGYLELEWICPQCRTRNAGVKNICATCGLAQPKNVGFVPPLHATILTTGSAAEAAAALVAAGADTHCPWCGVRNRATARQCTQCQGSLAGGEARQAGEDLGDLALDHAGDVACPACRTINASSARYCIMCGAPLGDAQEPPSGAPHKPEPEVVQAPAQPAAPVVPEPVALEVVPEAAPPAWIAAVVAALPDMVKGLSRRAQLWITIALLALIGALLVYQWWDNQPKTLVAQAANAEWERTIDVEAQTPVEASGWLDEMPAGVEAIACSPQARGLSEEPPNADAVEVCGTPYAVDTGTGIAEVFQDCLYEVQEDFCSWHVAEWQASPAVVAQGSGVAPEWPTLNATQREIGRSEAYTCTIVAGEREFTLEVDAEQFAKCAPGTLWTVRVDGSGTLLEAAPNQ